MKTDCERKNNLKTTLKPDKGHSLSEYLIILALVGIVAIPAFQFLGSTTSDGLSGVDSNDYNKLNALLLPKNGGSSSSPSNSSNNGSYDSVLEDFLANTGGGYTFNYNNGQITANGTETNSGDGGQLTTQLANSLSSMLTLIKEVDDLPLNVQASLDKLADFGQSLASAQDAFDTAPKALKNQSNATVYNDSTKTSCSGWWISRSCNTTAIKKAPTITTESQVRTDVLSTYETFVKQRKETVDLLNSLPPSSAKDTVQELVENYSTAITTIADQNYFTEGSYEIGGTSSSGTKVTQTPPYEKCRGSWFFKSCSTVTPEPIATDQNHSKLSAEQPKLLALGGGIATDGTSLPLFPPITRKYSEKIRESQRDARGLWRDKAKIDRNIAKVENKIQKIANKQNLLQAEIEKQTQAMSEAETSGDSSQFKKAEKSLNKAENKYLDAQKEKRDAQYDLIDAQKESRELNAQATAIDAETKAIKNLAIAAAEKQQAELQKNANNTSFTNMNL